MSGHQPIFMERLSQACRDIPAYMDQWNHVIDMSEDKRRIENYGIIFLLETHCINSYIHETFLIYCGANFTQEQW